MTNALGARIGEYLLERELPARTTEVAYRATHRLLPRAARLAILKPAFVGARIAEIQLMREACVLEALHHTGAPRAFEYGTIDDRPWIATELVDGTSIEHAAAQHPISIGEVIGVLRDVAAVLAHAHARGVVHRNLTPRSIVQTPARGFPICITEWGDASIHDSAIPYVHDPAARFYRAPELARGSHGEGQADGRVDVFALAAVMFEAATLVLPDPVQKFPGVPIAVHRLLAAMMNRNPEERPTAATVHADARRLAEGFAEGDGAIEEVEVELVDISRNQPTMASLGWIPPAQVGARPRHALGTMRRRKLP
ncbi:MAG TPA: protein kinase [Kofleriaceae bacterium]|nr:protein kinase [Kofleriaceae bacterium]